MSGWYFVFGMFAGSAWTLAVTHGLRLPRWRIPSFRPQFTTLTISDVGDYKIYTIKDIRTETLLGLREAKDVTEGQPLTLTNEAAIRLTANMRRRGVVFTTKPARKATA